MESGDLPSAASIAEFVDDMNEQTNLSRFHEWRADASIA
jgi:hypothetical protein